MTLRDLLDRAVITDVWTALGGGELRHGRGRAFWREGHGDNIALNETKSCFYDHAHGTGGGMLMLIETVLGCDRRAAVRWLAGHLGVTLDNDRPLTREEKRRYAQCRSHAQSAAQELTGWRRDTLRQLHDERNRLYLSENAVSAVARTLLASGDGSGNDHAWSGIWRHALDDLWADQIDREIRSIEALTPAELVALRCHWEGKAA